MIYSYFTDEGSVAEKSYVRIHWDPELALSILQ